MQGRGCASAAAAASPAGACVAPAGGGAAPAAAVGGALPAAAGSGVAAGADVGLVPSAASGSMASSSPAVPPTYTPCVQPSQAGITTGSNHTAGLPLCCLRNPAHSPCSTCKAWPAAPALFKAPSTPATSAPPHRGFVLLPPPPRQPAVCAATHPGEVGVAGWLHTLQIHHLADHVVFVPQLLNGPYVQLTAACAAQLVCIERVEADAVHRLGQGCLHHHLRLRDTGSSTQQAGMGTLQLNGDVPVPKTAGAAMPFLPCCCRGPLLVAHLSPLMHGEYQVWLIGAHSQALPIS